MLVFHARKRLQSDASAGISLPQYLWVGFAELIGLGLARRSAKTSASRVVYILNLLSTLLSHLFKNSKMRITELVIDGFKSYAVRTVISGWDDSFNSITGLNGSGKSNILDAICFVLGITSMSTVRAQNIQVRKENMLHPQGGTF